MLISCVAVQAQALRVEQASSKSSSAPSTTTTLTSGRRVERAIHRGEIHTYSVHAELGQVIDVLVEDHGVEATLALSDSSGAPLETVKTLSGTEDSVRLLAIAPSSGDYLLTVKPEIVLSRGHYRLTLDVRAPNEQDRAREAAQKATMAAEDLYEKHDYRGALDGFKSAATLWRRLKDGYDEGMCLEMTGSSYKAVSDRQNALAYYESARDAFTNVGSLRMQGYVLNQIAIVYQSIESVEGALGKALDYYTQALDVITRSGDRRGEALVLMNMAWVYSHLGQNDQAIERLQRALAISTEIGDTAREASALNGLGATYGSVAEPEKAFEIYRKALKLAQDQHDELVRHNRPTQSNELVQRNELVQASLLNNLGVLYSDLGDYRQALDYYNKAVSLLHKWGADNPDAKYSEATTFDNIGFCQLNLGNVKEALGHYKSALELHRAERSTLGETTDLEDIGDAFELLKNPAEAFANYTQALDLARKLGLRHQESYVLNKLGHYFASAGENDKALASFRAALPISRETSYKYEEVGALQGIAMVKRAQGDLSGARSEIESALAVIESLRSRVASRQLRASFLATREGAYEFYIDLLMQLDRLHPTQGYSALALQVSERARARSLLDTLEEAHADIRSGMDPNLLKEHARLQAELNRKAQREPLDALTPKEKEQKAAVERQIEDLLAELDQVESEMRARNPHYADLVAPHLLGLADIQKSIVDADTVLLEYSLGTEHSYLWVVTPDSLHTHSLPSESQIETEASRLRALLTARNQPVKFETPEEKAVRIAKSDAEYWSAAAEFSREILGPAAGELGQKRLVVVPQGALQYIPFTALPDPSAPAGNIKPLVVSHEIVTLPSASVLAVLRNEAAGRKPAAKDVAVLADPVFEEDDPRVLRGEARGRSQGSVPRARINQDEPQELNRPLPRRGQANALTLQHERIARLPYTRDEAEAILSLVPRNESFAALGFDANLKAATNPALGDYKILHFATHGFIYPRHPQLSGIVLSEVNRRGQPEDGFLRLNEIYNLRLPVDLVVLSGCDTGLGEAIKGEGLIGLTRGFMYAGAARVIVSLWDVSDRGTAHLMKLLYEGMLRKGLSPSRALQLAQVQVLKNRQLSAPYYWAAFEIQGDWK